LTQFSEKSTIQQKSPRKLNIKEKCEISLSVKPKKETIEFSKNEIQSKKIKSQEFFRKAENSILDAKEDEIEKIKELILKTKPLIHLKSTPHFIFLALPKENTEHRFFLEKVATALTNFFFPSLVIPLSNIDQLPPCKLLLAPLSFFKDIHQPVHTLSFYQETIPIMPLEELGCYLSDQNLKRSLWESLKHLLSQNLLP
jgi:hypothetical protein